MALDWKRRSHKLQSGIILLALGHLLAGCGSSTRADLRRISASYDPALLSLEPGYNDYVQRTSLTNGVEIRIITCRDGSSSRYWFRSHHSTDDDGGTLFYLSDGTRIFLSGWFCCEVQMPEEQPGSLTELRAFIETRDGVSP